MTPRIEMDFSGTGNFTVVNPRNWKSIEILGVYAAYTQSGSLESIHPSVSVQQIDLEFNGQDAVNIWAYRNAGLTGGAGLNNGIPLQIFDSASGVLVFDGVLDIGNARTTWECDKIVAPTRQNVSLDWFYNVIGSLEFSFLRSYVIPPGYSKAADGRTCSAGQKLFGAPGTNAVFEYKVTAYQITYEPELPHAINTMLHMISMINALEEAIKSTAKTVYNLGADVAEIATVLATVGGAIQLVWDLLAFVYDVLNDIVILSAMIGNIESLLNQFGLIDKYKYSMSVTDIIYGVLTFLNQQNGTPNLTFSSSIFGVGRNGVGYGGAYATTGGQALTWMPKKNIIMNQSVKPSISNFVNGFEHPCGDETKPGTLGPPYGTPDGNVKKFFQDLMLPFNAVIKLVPIGGSNDIQLEETHFWRTAVAYTLPNSGKVGFNKNFPDPHKTNWNELAYDYDINFTLDPKEGNTFTRYNGTTCNILIQPKISNNVLYWLNPGGKIIYLPFALAKTKQWLNLMDEVINFIIDLVAAPFNVLAGIYNAITSAINAVIGAFTGNVNTITALTFVWNPLTNPPYPYLELTEDTFSIPKLFIGFAMGSPPNTLNQNAVSLHPYYSKSGGSPSPFSGNCWQPSGANYGPPLSPYRDPNDSNNENYISADVLMRLFHSWNLATPAAGGYGGGNQWTLYEQKQFKMCLTDFLKIIQNGNVISREDGTPLFIEKILWRMYDEMALEVKYRINAPYTNNLTRQISIDGNPV